jgi:hypothetical protein
MSPTHFRIIPHSSCRLKVLYEPTTLEKVDVDVPFPRPYNTSQSESITDVDPAHYHIFMTRTSNVYNRFYQSLQRGSAPSEDVVRAADEQLALVIDILPDHLQPELGAQGGVRELERSQPMDQVATV